MHYHQPVLLKACIEGLNIKPDGVYVDVTFGGGGHSREILNHLNERGKLFAFDQDEDAMRNIPDDKRLVFIRQNFRFLANALRVFGITQVDGILADLGVSSHQFDVAERGFSIRFDGELDMRMNRSASKTAKAIINSYSEGDLIKIFRMYGEVENAGKLARVIVAARTENEINTTDELKKAIAPVTPKFNDHKYLAKVFQALRLEVNDELEVLVSFLEQSSKVLAPKGRLVVISYHSLEDRLVKNYMKAGNVEGEIKKDFFGKVDRLFELITRKPLIPNEEEIKENTRARSAKLRIAERL